MERWWDSPDAASNLALVDGSDPQMGMSIAVLGFHALTKAKLSDLETQTLVDRAQLEGAYDEADLEPVRKAITAATSEAMGPVAAAKYADSVLSDWTARSKEASGRLATTLVAKGLSWPRAVARTSNVAGVPLEHLSRYATVASAPGLDPLSAADAADRVLMEYAHRRGAMEASPTVVISKERERERIRQREVKNPSFEQEVERNELGQFAREAGTEAQKESETRKAKRAERRAKREKWNERRTQRAVQAQRATESTQPEAPGGERAKEGQVAREKGGEVLREKGGEVAREKRTEVMRESGGAADHEVVSARVALRDGITRPVLVDEPLYVVHVTKGASVIGARAGSTVPLVFRGTDAKKLAAHMRRVSPNDGVTLMVFPPGSLLLSGAVHYTRTPIGPGDTEYKTHGFRLAEYDKVEDVLQDFVPDTNDNPPMPTGPHARMAALTLHMIGKADEGRERMRSRRKIRNPEFEREVKRDELGQFAVEGEDTAEAMRMREERRAKRQERRAKREKWGERRAQRGVQAQQTTQAEALAEGQVVREKSEQVVREKEGQVVREKAGQVVREKRKQVSREKSRQGSDVNSADVWNFVDFVKWGSAGEETFTRFVPGSTMEAVGFAYRDTRGEPDPGKEIRVPTFYDQLRDGLMLPVDDVITDAIRQGAQFVSDAQNQNTYRYMEHTRPGVLEHEYKVKTEDDLMYVAMVHELAERLTVPLEGAKARPSYDSSREYDKHLEGPVPQMAAHLSNLMMKAMTQEFSLMGKRASTGYASVLSTGQGGHYKEAASTNEIGLHQVALMEPTSSGAPRLLASKRFKSYPGYEAGRGAVPYANEHSYISVVKPSTQYLMYVIANATRPDNSEKAQKQRANAIKVLRDAFEPQAKGGKALNLKGLVQEALKQSKVSVEMLDEQTKYGMVERTLRKPGAHAVRLDNIDILRFS